MPSVRNSTRIDGVLLLDKPSGPSSNTVLQHSKRLFCAQRAGHTGTLDPLASGLLPICFGEATKFGAHLLNADKGYVADLILGERTETGDAEGRVIERFPVNVTRDKLEGALALFRGEIEQVPPMYSAIKKDGQPLYKLARKGISVERAPRKVTIHRLELKGLEASKARIYVRCSKGTYVRTLAEDIGAGLGCGAHLGSLRRVEIGELDMSEAVTLEKLDLLSPHDRISVLRPVDSLVQGLPRVELAEEAGERFLHGQAVDALHVAAAARFGLVRVYAEQIRFLGIGEWNPEDRLSPRRMISCPQGT